MRELENGGSNFLKHQLCQRCEPHGGIRKLENERIRKWV